MSYFGSSRGKPSFFSDPLYAGLDLGGLNPGLLQSAIDENETAQAQKKRNFGDTTLGAIIGILGDGALGFVGQPAVYGPSIAEGRRRQQKMMEEYEQRQRERRENREDKIWERENLPSAPTQTDRYLAELEDPNTPPQRKAILRQILLRPIGVPVYGPDGSQKTEFYYPDQMPMGQQGGDDEWEYIDEGGAPQSGAPRFR